MNRFNFLVVIFLYHVLYSVTTVSGDGNSMLLDSVGNLLRFNFKGDTVSNDWSDYDIVSCDGEGKDKSCRFDVSLSSSSATSSDADKNDFASYMQSLTIWAALSIITAFLMICVGLYFSFYLCCCSINLNKSDIRNKTFVSSMNASQRTMYSTVCMTMTVVALSTTIILGIVLGATTLTYWIADIPDAAETAPSIVQSQTTAMGTMMAGIAGKTLAFFIAGLNDTFAKAIQCDNTLLNLDEINGTMYNLTGSVDDLVESIDAMELSIKSINDTINGVVDDLDDLDDQLDLTLNLLADLREGLELKNESSLLLEYVQNLTSLTDTINFDTVLDDVNSLEIDTGDIIDELSNLEIIMKDMNNSLQQTEGPLYDLVVGLQTRVEEQVVNISKFNSAFDGKAIYDDYNTVTEAFSTQAEDVLEKINDGKVQLEALNFSEYKVLLVDANQSYFDEIDNLNITDLEIALQFSNYFDFIDTNQYVIVIDAATSSVQEGKQSIIDIKAEISSSQSDLSAINFDDVTDELSSVNADVKKALVNISDYTNIFEGVCDFFHNDDDGLSKNLQKLDYDYLLDIRNRLGDGELLKAILIELDEIVNYFHNLSNTTETFDVSKSSLSENRQNLNFVEFLQNAGARGTMKYDLQKGGPLHFLALLWNSTKKKVIGINNTEAYTVLFDINDETYEEDQVCLTRQCFEETQNYYDQVKIAGFLTVSQVATMSFIPYIVICFIGLLLLLPTIMPIKNVSQQRGSTLFIGCIIFWVPIYFILAAIVFPILMGLADGCESYANTMYLYSSSYGDSLCLKLEGKGTFNECTFDIDGSLNSTVDLEHVLKSFLGIYSAGECNANKPFEGPISMLIENMPNYGDTKAGNWTEDYHLAAPMQTVLSSSLDSFVTVMQDFLTNINADVLDCAKITSLASDASEPFCNYMAGSVGWFIAMIFLSGWVLVCLGLPSGWLVRHKSIHNEIENKLFDDENESEYPNNRASVNSVISSLDVEERRSLATITEAEVEEEQGQNLNYETEVLEVEPVVYEDQASLKASQRSPPSAPSMI